MAITTWDQLLAALATAQRIGWNKLSITTVAGGFYSMWDVQGDPGAGLMAIGNTTTGIVPTDGTAGAFTINAPTGGNLLYLAQANIGAAGPLSGILYDRLWHAGSFNANQAIGTPFNTSSPAALTRPDANGENTELWLEVNAAISNTATSISIGYTNSAGTSGRATPAISIQNLPTRRMALLPFQTGDVGIRSIQSFTTSGTVASAGTFNLIIARRLFTDAIPGSQVGPGPRGPTETGMPQVYDASCLALMCYTFTTSSGQWIGDASIAQG